MADVGWVGAEWVGGGWAEIDTNFPDHYFNRGAILRRLGCIPEAMEDFGQAMSGG